MLGGAPAPTRPPPSSFAAAASPQRLRRRLRAVADGTILVGWLKGLRFKVVIRTKLDVRNDWMSLECKCPTRTAHKGFHTKLSTLRGVQPASPRVARTTQGSWVLGGTAEEGMAQESSNERGQNLSKTDDAVSSPAVVAKHAASRIV